MTTPTSAATRCVSKNVLVGESCDIARWIAAVDPLPSVKLYGDFKTETA